jgi:hypothetical protein
MRKWVKFLSIDGMWAVVSRYMLWTFRQVLRPSRPPLWSSGQSSWLHIQRSGLDSRRYQIFWEVVFLEWGPLSLVTTIEGLLERKSSCSGLESREYGRRDPSRRPRGTLYPQKFALTSPTSGGRSLGIVGSRTRPTEFSLVNLQGTYFSEVLTSVCKRTLQHRYMDHRFWCLAFEYGYISLLHEYIIVFSDCNYVWRSDIP